MRHCLTMDLDSGRIKQLTLITYQRSKLCSIQALQYKNKGFELVGCETVAERIQDLYTLLRLHMRFPPVVGGSVKRFDHDLPVTNYRPITPFVGNGRVDSPQKHLRISHLRMDDVQALANQLEPFIIFMTGWPPLRC